MRTKRKDMSSLDAVIEQARTWAVILEDEASFKTGEPLPVVRPLIARDVGCAPGTLENLRKRRLKRLDHLLFDGLRRAFDRRLERQLRQIEHERHLLIQQGVDPRSDEVQAVETDAVAIRRALGLPS